MADPKKERMFQIINFSAVLVAGILVGIVVMQIQKGKTPKAGAGAAQAAAPPSSPPPPPPPAGTEAVPPPPADGSKPGLSQDVTVTIPEPPVQLSQRAKVLATEYYCMCQDKCQMVLFDCTCSRNPGQRSMKLFLQALVDQEKTSEEIRSAMIAKFGESVRIP